MKNPIKSYFLFFSLSPIFFNVILFIIGLMGYLIYASFSMPSNSTLGDGIFPWLFWSFAGIVLAHIFLIYFIMRKYISRGQYGLFDDSRNWFCGLITKDGRKIILDKPMWLKGKKFEVSEPNHYFTGSKTWNVSTLVHGKYKNSQVSIPVTLRFILSSEFDKQEVFSALAKDQPDNSVHMSIDHYTQDVFKKFNERNQPVVDDAIKRYSERLISEPVLLDTIIEVLIFPERLFSNITDVNICLGHPDFSSCKGTSCGN